MKLNRENRRKAKRLNKPVCKCGDFIISHEDCFKVGDTTLCYKCGIEYIKRSSKPIVVIKGDNYGVKEVIEYNDLDSVKYEDGKPQINYEHDIPCLWFVWKDNGITVRVERFGPVVKGLDLMSKYINKIEIDKLKNDKPIETNHFVITPLVDTMGCVRLAQIKNKESGETFLSSPNWRG